MVRPKNSEKIIHRNFCHFVFKVIQHYDDVNAKLKLTKIYERRHSGHFKFDITKSLGYIPTHVFFPGDSIPVYTMNFPLD